MAVNMNAIADRYQAHADAFERTVAAVPAEAWTNPSPCAEWNARDVVRHIVDMHAAMLQPLDRRLSLAPSVDDDPLAAFRAARADVEAVLADAEVAGSETETPMGTVAAEQQIDQVVSDDMVVHRWDLAKATGQDSSMDPDDIERLWAATSALPAELLERFRTPGAFGPGIVVFGPEVPVAPDAPLQDRLLGLIGRDPAWTPD